jgi:hypothetical protein
LILILRIETVWRCVTPPSRAFLARDRQKHAAPAPPPPVSAPQHSRPSQKAKAK